MISTFREFYYLNEVKDTKRNREEVARAYGLTDNAPEHVAKDRAKELIDKFTKLEPLIDPNHDYFGLPGKKYNPKDMFSWARLVKDEGYDKLEALQNFEAMLINLGRAADRKEQAKLSEKDYEVLVDNEHATLYRPKSMSASCKLGAGTKWCTAANVNNQFDSYIAQGVVLFYAITKRKQFNTAKAVWPPQPAANGSRGRATGSDFKPEEKYAVAMYPGGEVFEYFDSEDNKIDQSDWEYTFDSLGLPTDHAFYKKHGPSAVSLLKNSVNDAQSKMSGSTQRDPYGDGDTNWELLNDVLDKVKIIFKDKDPDQLAELAKYRRDEGQPDEVFLMDVMENASMEYFTDREYNPPGSNNWANSQFQQEIVRNIGRLTYMVNQVNGDDWKQEDVEDMDDLIRVVGGPGDGDEARNYFYQLRLYISRHLNDKWPELENALLKLWETNHDAVNIKEHDGYSELSSTPFDSSLMWLRMMMEIKNGEWPELEQMLHNRVKSVLHAGDKDPEFENKKNGIQSMAVSFNHQSNFRRQLKNTDWRAWLPQSDEHFKRYMDGEWDIDGPPLTDQAQSERQYKNYSKSNTIDEYVSNL